MNIMPEYYYASACSCMPVVRWNHVKVCDSVSAGRLRSKTTKNGIKSTCRSQSLSFWGAALEATESFHEQRGGSCIYSTILI